MTGKLIKYEIKSSIRLISIIWAALMASSVLVGIVNISIERLIPEGSFKLVQGLLTLIPPLVYGAIFMAMIVITMLMVIWRFYRGLLSDEGYLMHTLPVKIWQLITSKGIAAALIVIVSCIAAILSILILIVFSSGFGEMMDAVGEMARACREEPQIILIAVEVMIVLVASVLKSIYQIYAAMAIGQLSGKFRGLLSLGAYIALSAALTTLAAIAVSVADATGLDVWLTGLTSEVSILSALHLALGLVFLLTAVQLAVFHVIAERILTKKLNLL